MESFALSLLKSMVSIYSPTGSEERLASFLKEELARLGFKAHVDAVGNVVAELGQGPAVLLCGHMDTVEGRLPVKVVDGRLYGRGAVDAKGPLASMIVASKLYASNSPRLKLVLACVVDEEGYGEGIKHLVNTLEQPQYAFFGEPSDTYGVTVGYRGSLLAQLFFKTKKGHLASQGLFTNALELAVDAWGRLKEETSKRSRPESRFYSLEASLIKLASPRTLGVVPFRATALVNLRTPPSVTCRDVAELLEQVVGSLLSSREGVEGGVRVIDCVEAFREPYTSPPVRALQRAIIKQLGRKPKLLLKTGTGDVNVAKRSWPIPMAVYGPGDSRLDHTDEENIVLQDYLDSIRVCAEALKQLEQIHFATAKLSSA
ncbi:MAG: M20/M25/M40 family metallo-hydrolase [Candidatus Nezhaarchaeota archaeon]|nr:M20/M25/M40 family metallo-hydrolase [Candidatus Nezhaarchaeota archaeon]